MKLSTLPFLACPRRWSSTPCGGTLSLHASPAFPPRPLAQTGPGAEELREGLLRCARCETEFPVLSGVAVLFPDPEAYFRRFFHPVVRDLERHGDLSPTGWTWLRRRFGKDGGREEYGADFRFSQQFEHPAEVAAAVRRDAERFYGPFLPWLRETRNPYEILAGWAAELPPPRGLAVDAGCGVGGLLSRAAGAFQAAFGADLSFLAILLARRAVLRLPEPERTYLLTPRCGDEVERPLRALHAPNAEFVVGDCAALPFPDGLFDAVLSCNVIDIAGISGPLDEAARLLRPAGALLLSDPFFFREGQAPPGDPVAAVRDALAERHLHPARETDGVPWIWATYDRHFRLYFNYCVQAVKGMGSR